MSSDAALCEIQRAKDVEQGFLKYLQKSMSHSEVVEQIVQGKYYMEDSEAPMFCKCFSVCHPPAWQSFLTVLNFAFLNMPGALLECPLYHVLFIHLPNWTLGIEWHLEKGTMQ